MSNGSALKGWLVSLDTGHSFARSLRTRHKDWYVEPRLPSDAKGMAVIFDDDHLSEVVGQEVRIEEVRGYLWRVKDDLTVMGAIQPRKLDFPWAGGSNMWTPFKVLLDLDMQKARKELELSKSMCKDGAGFAPCTDYMLPLLQPSVSIYYNDCEYIQHQEAYLTGRDSDFVALDIENHTPYDLSCLGAAWSPYNAVVWQAPNPIIKKVCESSASKIFQNGAYDRYFLKSRCGIDVRNHAFDTILGWHALEPELAGAKQEVSVTSKARRITQKSLRFLASIYCRIPWWKDYDFSTEEERMRLCGIDCCITYDIAMQMMEELRVKKA